MRAVEASLHAEHGDFCLSLHPSFRVVPELYFPNVPLSTLQVNHPAFAALLDIDTHINFLRLTIPVCHDHPHQPERRVVTLNLIARKLSPGPATTMTSWSAV